MRHIFILFILFSCSSKNNLHLSNLELLDVIMIEHDELMLEMKNIKNIKGSLLEIDGIEEKYSQDMLEYQLQLENGNLLLKEDGGSLIKENYSTNIEPIDNVDFDNLITLEGILDFSEKNPFGEIGA